LVLLTEIVEDRYSADLIAVRAMTIEFWQAGFTLHGGPEKPDHWVKMLPLYGTLPVNDACKFRPL